MNNESEDFEDWVISLLNDCYSEINQQKHKLEKELAEVKEWNKTLTDQRNCFYKYLTRAIQELYHHNHAYAQALDDFSGLHQMEVIKELEDSEPTEGGQGE